VPAGADEQTQDQAYEGKEQAEFRTDFRTRVCKSEYDANDDADGQGSQQQSEELTHDNLLAQGATGTEPIEPKARKYPIFQARTTLDPNYAQ
jgi:hypothetical protein